MTKAHMKWLLGLFGALAVGSGPLADSKIFVYAAQGQTDSEVADDRYQCHVWAVTQSGFDPSVATPAPAAGRVVVPVAANRKAGAATKGAAAGAVVGGVVGANGGDTLEGVAIGAVVGAAAGAVIAQRGAQQARDDAREEAGNQAAEIAATQAEAEQRRGDYGRATKACLESRGYTVR